MKKIISVMAVVLLLVYIGYQISHNLTEQIETIDALNVTVEDKVTCRGFFVRSASAVSGDTSKTYEFLVENGEKVSRGQTIAACFDSADAAEAFRSSMILEKDIANAEQAYKSILSDDGGVTLDSSIFDGMEKLSGLLKAGEVWDTDAVYSQLTQAVVAREYPREDASGLENAIADMKSQLAAYKRASSGSSYTMTAKEPGYFVRAAESSPSICTPDEMYSLTPDDVDRLTEAGAGDTPDGIIGYVVDGFEWYFICAVDDVQASQLEKMSYAGLSFPYMTSESVRARVEKVSYYDDRDVVIFSCGNMNSEFLGGGVETVDIIKSTYTGIRIPKEALHQGEDGQWGIYCLSGAVVKFKPIEWIYQGDTYYIAKQAESAQKGLYLYDKVIVKGKNIQPNMVIK